MSFYYFNVGAIRKRDGGISFRLDITVENSPWTQIRFTPTELAMEKNNIISKHATLVSKRLDAVEKGLDEEREITPDFSQLYQDSLEGKDKAFDRYMVILDKNNVHHGAYDKIILVIDDWDASKTATRVALFEGEIKRPLAI